MNRAFAESGRVAAGDPPWPPCLLAALADGVDFLLCLVTDFSAEVIWRKRLQTNPEDGQVAIQQQAFDLAAEAIEFGKKECGRCLGIGIAIPALVDAQNGIVKLAPNLKWENVPLRLIWNQQFHYPVYVENDGNAAALGEYYFGAAAASVSSISRPATGWVRHHRDGKLLRETTMPRK
jgi:predicted NBD/HSP70 family sugar kinase